MQLRENLGTIPTEEPNYTEEEMILLRKRKLKLEFRELTQKTEKKRLKM